jgi:hypothetical protein
MTTIARLIFEGKLDEAKEKLLAIATEETSKIVEDYKRYLADNILSEARFKIVRVRIRKGKIERRKKVSTIKGYTIRNGKMKRMTPRERLKRRMGQRRGKIKRKVKTNIANMKRKRSMRRLKGLGGAKRR